MGEQGGLRVVTGDEMGMVKLWDVEKRKRLRVHSCGKVARSRRIDSLCWADSEDEQLGVLYVSRGAGLNFVRGLEMEKWEACHSIAPQGPCVGLEVLKEQKRAVTCFENGNLSVVRFHPDEEEAGAFGKEIELSMDVSGPLSRMRISPFSGFVATGGKEMGLKLWDCETKQKRFQAKNVKHDFLDMRVPIWVTDIQFLRGVRKSDKGPKEAIGGGAREIIATCSGYGHLNVYDTAMQKRPVQSWKLKTATELYRNNVSAHSHHINCMHVKNEHSMVLGDAAGDIYEVDMRTMKEFSRFRPLGGSIRAIEKHPLDDFILAASLDRYLQIYDSNTRNVVSRIYTNTGVTCALFSASLPVSIPAQGGKDGQEQAKKRPFEQVLKEDHDVVEEFSDESSEEAEGKFFKKQKKT